MAILLATGCSDFVGKRPAHPNPWRPPDQSAQLRPAALVIDDPWHGPVHVAKVRVLASAEYRSQVPNWRQRVASQIAAVNPLLVEALGLRLEIVDYRDWDLAASEDVHTAGDALVMQHPGNDVDWVIGMIGALPRIVTDYHALGAARPRGRHIILRGMHSLAEAREIGGRINAQMYQERLRHKEKAVFLHELAHTLGAGHESDPHLIMSPIYSDRVSRFSPQGLALIRVGLAERLGRSPDPDPGAGLRPVDRASYEEANRRLRAGDAEGALDAAADLFELQGDQPAVALLECAVRERLPAGRGALAACRRATDLAPADPDPALRVAELAAGEPAADQLAGLARVRARLQARAGKPAQPQWARLAALYRRIDLPTAAAQAAAAAGEPAAQVAAWAQQSRTRLVILDGLAEERELAYVASMRRLLRAIDPARPTATERDVAAARRSLGALPGFDLILCDLAARRMRHQAAETHCGRVLATMPGASWAHFLLGALAAQRRAHARAIEHLRAAIAADPDLAAAYVSLARVHQAQGDVLGLQKVKNDYRRQFKQPLR